MGDLWKWLSLTVLVVLVGICLKDGSQVTAIMNSYANILGTLEKAG